MVQDVKAILVAFDRRSTHPPVRSWCRFNQSERVDGRDGETVGSITKAVQLQHRGVSRREVPGNSTAMDDGAHAMPYHAMPWHAMPAMRTRWLTPLQTAAQHPPHPRTRWTPREDQTGRDPL